MYLRSIIVSPEDFPRRDLYPFNIPAFQSASHLDISALVTIFVGQNGSGKSALLDAVARKSGFLPWGGSKIHRSHGNPYETHLANHVSLHFEPRHAYGFHFRAEAFFNFASSLDDMIMDDPGRDQYFGGKSLNVVSHGESYLAFFKSYSFQLAGLYLIDEPEAALSPGNQVEFVRTILQGIRSGNKQYIIATHSPIILACPGASLLNFDAHPIQPTDYRSTRHYLFYKTFLDNPESFFNSEGRYEDPFAQDQPTRRGPQQEGKRPETEV